MVQKMAIWCSDDISSMRLLNIGSVDYQSDKHCFIDRFFGDQRKSPFETDDLRLEERPNKPSTLLSYFTLRC